MRVPLEVGANLVLDARFTRRRVGIAGQICVDRQCVAAAVVERLDSLGLRANTLHHPDTVDIPDEGGLPIDGLGNPLQGLVGWQMVRALFPAHACQGIGKHGIPSPDAKLNGVLRCAMQ